MGMTVRFTARMWMMLAACGFAIPFAHAGPAHAVQHLVRSSDDWESLGRRLRPGDEIILMPGQHREASFDTIIGTRERPITIRGIDPDNPSTIVAEREGVRINAASHVILKDFVITGAKINGIHIAGGEAADQTDAAPSIGDVVIRNVRIMHTGPRGQRHGVLLRYVRNVRIEDCRIEGWGGSAIEMLGCENVTVSRCHLKGIADYSQNAGVRIRAGSQSVELEECRIENAGDIAICIGVPSRIEEFAPAMLANASEATLFEAARVNVQRSLIIGSQCAVSAGNADGWTVRNNTIYRPRRCIFTFAADQADARFHSGRNGVIGRNLIAWEPGDVKSLFEISSKVDAQRVSLDANLWWSPESEEDRNKLGPIAGRQILPQIVDVDPKLDEHLKPQTPEALEFGS